MESTQTSKTKIAVIIGSTRPSRFSEKPAHYLFDELKKREDVEAELIDLRDFPMPFFDSPVSPARLGGKYPHEIVQKWADKINESDGYVIVSPEYNHGYPAVLKNALDWIYPELNIKPVGFVSYGNLGGSRVVEQLRTVAIEFQMLPIRNAIHVPGDIYQALVNEKIPVNPDLFKPLREGMRGDRIENFFNELIGFAVTLKAMRG